MSTLPPCLTAPAMPDIRSVPTVALSDAAWYYRQSLRPDAGSPLPASALRRMARDMANIAALFRQEETYLPAELDLYDRRAQAEQARIDGIPSPKF